MQAVLQSPAFRGSLTAYKQGVHNLIEATKASGPLSSAGQAQTCPTAQAGVPSHSALDRGVRAFVVRQLSRLVISRHSFVFRLLECAVLLAVLSTVLLVPLQLAFEPAVLHFNSIDFALDCIFLVNIVLDFVTATEVDGIEIFDADVCIRDNLRGNFMRDVLAAAPWPLVADILRLDAFVSMRVIALLRMTRVFTMTHLQLLTGRSTTLKLAKLSLSVFMMSHWLGCMWIAVSKFEDNPENGFAVGSALAQQSNWVLYARAFHWGMLSLISMGGSNTPTLASEIALGVSAGLVVMFITTEFCVAFSCLVSLCSSHHSFLSPSFSSTLSQHS